MSPQPARPRPTRFVPTASTCPHCGSQPAVAAGHPVQACRSTRQLARSRPGPAESVRRYRSPDRRPSSGSSNRGVQLAPAATSSPPTTMPPMSARRTARASPRGRTNLVEARAHAGRQATVRRFPRTRPGGRAPFSARFALRTSAHHRVGEGVLSPCVVRAASAGSQPLTASERSALPRGVLTARVVSGSSGFPPGSTGARR